MSYAAAGKKEGRMHADRHARRPSSATGFPSRIRAARRMKPLPVMPGPCPTCPFRPGSKYADLAPMLAQAALESTRICHSTGGNNAINRRTGNPPAACAGARKVALEAIAGMGIIAAPTEAAWQAECDRRGIRNGIAHSGAQTPNAAIQQRHPETF